MSLVAAPYSSLSQLPPLHSLTSLSPAKRRTLAASTALSQLQSFPIQLHLLVDPSSTINPYFGLLITAVTPHSTVWEAGVRPGDVLLEVNGVRTVDLNDVRVGLEGCIAGDVVPLVVERKGEEMELRVMIAAKGVDDEEVRSLYRLLMDEVAAHDALVVAKAASPLSPPLTSSSLSLSDLLDTPQFAQSLLSYMDGNLCSECLHFLLAERAYQRIPPSELGRMLRAARAMYDTFIAEDALQMVNLDSVARKDVQDAVLSGDISSTLFLAAAREVYQLTETDVLPRYFQSSAFASLASPSGWVALNDSSVGRGRRRSHSFSCVPMEERRVELEDMRAAFLAEAAGEVCTHRKGLTKHRDSFRGSVLVEWMARAGVASHEASAFATAQRLMDALLLWRCEEGDEDVQGDFAGDDTLFTMTPPDSPDSPDDDSVEGCYVLMKGVRYTRMWMRTSRRRKRVSLYRDSQSTQLLFKASLRHATLTLATPHSHSTHTSSPSTSFSSLLPPSTVSPASTPPFSSSSTSTTATPSRSSSSRAVVPVTPPPSPLSIDGPAGGFVSRACYLNLRLKDGHASRKELVLRVDDEKEARSWAELLSELGVKVKGL